MRWTPRSGYETLHGCIWLPLLLDKARRVAAGSGHLIDGEWMYGDNDFADGILLRFLGVSDAKVVEIVRAQSDDAAAGAQLLAIGGKTPAQIAAFNRRFRLAAGAFMPLIEADEGRAAPSPWTNALRALYNGVIAGPAIAVFKWMQR